MALEGVCLPTGLGVTEYVAVPEPLSFQAELARFAGQPVYAASLNVREDLRDDDLVAVVSGLAGEPPVFRRPLPGRGDSEWEHFIKTGPGQYVRVHQGPERTPFAGGKVGCVKVAP